MSLSQNQLFVSRFYLAAFNRAPDLGSLNAHTQELDSGTSFKDVFSRIWSDPEVQHRFPDTASDADFITSAYQKVFNRAPDNDGRDYWAAKLSNHEQRSTVLFDIVTAGLTAPDGVSGKEFILNREASAQYAVEQQVNTGSALNANTLTSILGQVNEDPLTISTAATRIDLACADQPALSTNQLAVCRIYLALFNRAPDLGGLNNWTAELDAGKSVETLATEIYESPSVKPLFPDSVSNRDFVIQTYQDLFNRSLPDDEGVNYWTAALDNNQSRGSLRLAMVDAGCHNADGTEGKALITNRLESSQYATLTQLAQGCEIPVAHLDDLMTQINDNHASVDSVSLAIDTETASIAAGGSDSPPDVQTPPVEESPSVPVPPPTEASPPTDVAAPVLTVLSTEINPHVTEVLPLTTEVLPPSTEVTPPATEVIPPTAVLTPPAMEAAPTSTEVATPANETPPANSDILPTTETTPTTQTTPQPPVDAQAEVGSPPAATTGTVNAVPTPGLDLHATITEFVARFDSETPISQAHANVDIVVDPGEIASILLVGQNELAPVL